MDISSSTQTSKEQQNTKQGAHENEVSTPCNKSGEKTNVFSKLISKTFLSNLVDLCRCLGEEDDELETESTNPTQRQVLKPVIPEKKKKTLALEVDQVMIFATYVEMAKSDIAIKFETDKSSNQEIFVYIRPGLTEFLTAMSQIFEIVVYTSGNRKFLEPLIGILDENNVISSKLYREDCYEVQGKITKDLQKLKCDLKDVIFVKSSANSPLLQTENCLEIPPFEGSKADTELAKLANLLYTMKDLADVRPCGQFQKPRRARHPQVQALNMRRPGFNHHHHKKLLSLKELPTLEDQDSPMLKQGRKIGDTPSGKTDNVGIMDTLTCSSKILDKENGSHVTSAETSLLNRNQILSP